MSSWSRDHWTFSLALPPFFTQRIKLFNNLYNFDSSFSKSNNKDKVSCLLYGSTNNSYSLNKDVTEYIIKFLKLTGRRNKQLLLELFYFFLCFFAVFIFLSSLRIFFLLLHIYYFEFQYHYLYLATSTDQIISVQFCFSWFHCNSFLFLLSFFAISSTQKWITWLNKYECSTNSKVFLFSLIVINICVIISIEKKSWIETWKW